MSKIFKPFIALFKGIYKIIDKIIVTPISRVLYKLNEIIKTNSGKLEKILNRPNILIYVSLICAIATFLLIDSKVITLTEQEAEIIADQPISVIYNEEAYVVEGIPESVDITLIGSKSTLYLATQLGNHEVVLDLSNYGTGTYKVKLKYNHSVQSIDYKLDPSTVTVKISEKVSEVRNLSYDIMNESKLDSKLSISGVTLDTNEVIIKSSQEILDKVASVKALVDASQIDASESGDFTIDDVKLVAYDETGEKIDNVEIVPSKVAATVKIDNYHDTKQVKVVTTGTMASGKAISGFTTSVSSVTIYGEKSVVDAIAYVEAEVSIDNLSEDKTVSVNLAKPNGIRYMSDTTTNVTIAVGDSSQKTVDNVSVTFTNLGSAYTVSAASDTDKVISVIAKGVASVINTVGSQDGSKINAYIDLSGYKSGTYTVPVIVSIDDERVTLQAVKTEVTVKIMEK